MIDHCKVCEQPEEHPLHNLELDGRDPRIHAFLGNVSDAEREEKRSRVVPTLERIEDNPRLIEALASAETPSAVAIDVVPIAPTDEEVRRVIAEIESVSVSDVLDLASRAYAVLLENPPDIRMATGIEYLMERTRAQSELFRDLADPTKCALGDSASGTDLLRGLRVLALRHPIPEAQDTYRAIGNQIAQVLTDRAGGFGVDLAPLLDTPGGTRRTLHIWHEQVMRASQAARQIATSGGRGPALSIGGIALIGKSASIRAKLIVDFQMQGMAELGVLIDHVGLALADKGPEYRPAPR